MLLHSSGTTTPHRPAEPGTTSRSGLTYSSRELTALRPSIDKLALLHRQTSCSAVRLSGCHKSRCSCCRGTRAGRVRLRSRAETCCVGQAGQHSWIPKGNTHTSASVGFSHDHNTDVNINKNIGLFLQTLLNLSCTFVPTQPSVRRELLSQLTFQSFPAVGQAQPTVTSWLSNTEQVA